MPNNVGSEGVFPLTHFVIHVVAFLSFTYAIYYDYFHVRIPREVHSIGSSFGGKFKFLTFWDAIIQAVYFGIALLSDLATINEKPSTKEPLIRRIRNYVFATFAFPLAMFVGTTFWSLMAIDRELVFPKALDPYFPMWLNHVMHTNIMVFVLVEIFSTFHIFPRRSRALTGLIMLVFFYLSWVHVIFYISGQWVYPVLEVLNGWQRAVFFLAMISYSCFLYVVGENMNSFVWGGELKIRGYPRRQSQKKKKYN